VAQGESTPILEETQVAKEAKEGDEGKGMDGVQVTARILPENQKVYDLLVMASRAKGWSQEEVNTSLINAGLVSWVDRISQTIEGAEGEEPGTPQAAASGKGGRRHGGGPAEGDGTDKGG
jgi:hypothetical protein